MSPRVNTQRTSGNGDASPAPLTRRERNRIATFSEIAATGRALLREPEGITLRGVAAAMGMTAPALYRYVGSYHDLLRLVGKSVTDDLLAAMTAARDRHPDDTPAQLMATTVTFRQWSLAHPEEFRLIFTHPATLPAEEPLQAPPPDDPMLAFVDLYFDMFLEQFARTNFPLPPAEQLDPAVTTLTEAHCQYDMLPPHLQPLMPQLVWVFERTWVRLFGTVALEVFGHLHPDYIANATMFRAVLNEIAADLAMTSDWERLGGVFDTEMHHVTD